METICKPRKWGNSLGIIIPKEVVDAEGIKEGKEIVVNIRKNKVNLSNLFGKLKGYDLDAQKMKDESRKIWDM